MNKNEIENAVEEIFTDITEFVCHELDDIPSRVYVEIMESRSGVKKALVRKITSLYDINRKQLCFPGCCNYCVGISGFVILDDHDNRIAKSNITIHLPAMYIDSSICDNCKKLVAQEAINDMNIRLDHYGFETVNVDLKRKTNG